MDHVAPDPAREDGGATQQRAIEAVSEVVASPVYESYPSFDEFGGLDQEIERLKEAAVLFSFPELCKEWDVTRPTAILLHGPGGVGKTELAKAFTRGVGAELLATSVSDIQDAHVGVAEKKLRDLFAKAKRAKERAVIFIDEFDGLFSKEAGGNRGSAQSLVSEMKAQLGDLVATQPNTIVIAATNNLENFDPALLRAGRFDVIIGIGLPNDEARAKIFGKSFEASPHLYDFGTLEEPGLNLDELVRGTDGMSGADIKSILNAARMKKLFAQVRTGEPQNPVSQRDILKAIRMHRQTHSDGS